MEGVVQGAWLMYMWKVMCGATRAGKGPAPHMGRPSPFVTVVVVALSNMLVSPATYLLSSCHRNL